MLYQAWKPGVPYVAEDGKFCFNGAMLYQAWKLFHDLRNFVLAVAASMEPCFIKHGNREEFDAMLVPEPTLQWSHALSSMETCWKPLASDPSTSASMEPCFIKHGNLNEIGVDEGKIACFNGAMLYQAWKLVIDIEETRDVPASMEPCFIKHGNKLRRAVFGGMKVASMEPCFIKHGNVHYAMISGSIRDGFNGAMLYQAWKPPFARSASTIPRTLQWSHALSSMETCAKVSAAPSPGRYASMEPCFIKHGNCSRNSEASTAGNASMEPCFIKHGNAVLAQFHSRLTRASMEPCFIKHGNILCLRVGLILSHASMEPCFIKHGNANAGSAYKSPVSGLQWSHALSSMETRLIDEDGGISKTLQWSHALSSMETE